MLQSASHAACHTNTCTVFSTLASSEATGQTIDERIRILRLELLVHIVLHVTVFCWALKEGSEGWAPVSLSRGKDSNTPWLPVHTLPGNRAALRYQRVLHRPLQAS